MDEVCADYRIRVIVVGDSTVGKTCLLQYFSEGRLASSAPKHISDPTIGVDFFCRQIVLDCGTRLKLQIWDTAGQDRFRSITQSYYRHSCGVILVFDITNRSTFLSLDDWMQEAITNISECSPSFILVGSKTDLHRRREVSTEEAAQWADTHHMPYIECSAVSGENITQLFHTLSASIYRRLMSGEYILRPQWEGILSCTSLPHTVSLTPQEEPVSSSCC